MQDLRTYDAVSKDIVRRWVYPIVPENNLFSESSYQFFRGGVYKENEASPRAAGLPAHGGAAAQVEVDRSAHVGNDTVIGAGTKIAANASVQRSVLGRNVRIGPNVEIEGCYIWDGAVLEEGSSSRWLRHLHSP